MAKGLLDVLGDAVLEHPTALAWDRDSSTPEPGMEPPSISRCCQGVCSRLWSHQVPGVGVSDPSAPSPCL